MGSRKERQENRENERKTGKKRIGIMVERYGYEDGTETGKSDKKFSGDDCGIAFVL